MLAVLLNLSTQLHTLRTPLVPPTVCCWCCRCTPGGWRAWGPPAGPAPWVRGVQQHWHKTHQYLQLYMDGAKRTLVCASSTLFPLACNRATFTHTAAPLLARRYETHPASVRTHGLVSRVPGGNRHSRLSIAAKYLSKAASGIATIATDLPLSCLAPPYLASPHPACYSCMLATVSGLFCLHPAPHPLLTQRHNPSGTARSAPHVHTPAVRRLQAPARPRLSPPLAPHTPTLPGITHLHGTHGSILPSPPHRPKLSGPMHTGSLSHRHGARTAPAIPPPSPS